MLEAGDVDLVVGNLPIKTLGIEFQTEHLYRDPILLTVRRNHPLTYEKNLEWKMLSKFPMVLPPSNAVTRMAIEETLSNAYSGPS